MQPALEIERRGDTCDILYIDCRDIIPVQYKIAIVVAEIDVPGICASAQQLF